MSTTVEFVCTVEANPFNSENFKIYGVSVDRIKYPNIKLNKYNNVSIMGNVHELGLGIEYCVTAEEQQSKYGIGYKVLNIRRTRPMDETTTRMFLYEILTYSQVDSLMKVYPDIVDRVINNRLDDIDLNKLYDIKQARFEVIKRKIIENFALAELVDEFKGVLSFDILKRLYEVYPSTIKIKQALRDNPYNCLCGLSRIGFKTADAILLDLDKECKALIKKGEKPPIQFACDLKTSKERQKALLMYLLEENESNGNTKIGVKDLRKEAEKNAIECINHFVDVIKFDEEIHFDKVTQSVSKTETYNIEIYIRNKILEGLKHNVEWNFDVSKYKSIDGISLTDMQLNALKTLCKYNISIFNGFGGTGKSQTTRSIIQMLKDNYKSFKLLSPTGRAAKVLSEFTKENASTIHRGLGYMPPNDWMFNEFCPFSEDVIIVDETSMVDIFLMQKLLMAIDFTKTKLLLIGDSAQIPSVGAGNVLFDLLNSNIISTTTLTQVFRYGNGGILTVATKTRNCENFLSNSNEKQVFGEDKGYVYVPIKQTELIGNVEKFYKKLLEQYKPEDILVLSSYNKGEYGTVAINQKLQPIANENARNKKMYIKLGETTFYENDMVIQNVNNYKAVKYPVRYNEAGDEIMTFIPNGEIGKILEIRKDELIIQFDETVIYNKNELTMLKLAYSISCHKSQGGQAKIVVLLTPKSHTFMLNSNLIYVGQTRAKERVYHLGETETINRAIKKKADFNRNTFLKDLLTQEIAN